MHALKWNRFCQATKLADVLPQPDGSVKMSNMTIIAFTLYLVPPLLSAVCVIIRVRGHIISRARKNM